MSMKSKSRVKKLILAIFLATAGIFGMSSILIDKQNNVEITEATTSRKPTTGDTIYLVNKSNWSSVYVYYFNDSKQAVGNTWPGTQITSTVGTVYEGGANRDVYATTIPSGATYVIFNNNSGSQTGDLQFDHSDSNEHNAAFSDYDKGSTYALYNTVCKITKKKILGSEVSETDIGVEYISGTTWTKPSVPVESASYLGVDWYEDDQTTAIGDTLTGCDWDTTVYAKYNYCGTETLYFVGNYNWSNYKNDYSGAESRCWPYITANFKDGSSYTGKTSGAMDRNPDFNKDDRTFVWYFTGVPLKPMSSLTFNFTQNHACYVSFAAETYDQWVNSSGVHYTNVFGMNGSDWTLTNNVGVTGSYYYSSSYAFLAGSFADNTGINWTQWPTISNSFEYNSTSERYEITLNVDTGDEFKYGIYNCLANKKTSPATWGLDSYSFLEYATNGRITVYDGDTEISNNGAWTDYIDNTGTSSQNIRFARNGRVTISRGSNSAGDYDIRITFLSSGRPSPAGDSTEPNYVQGTVDNWGKISSYPITFNYSRGRYESVVALFNNDLFKYYGGGYLSVAPTNISQLNSASVVAESAAADAALKLSSATDYYVIGYYFSNTSGDGTPTRAINYFIDKLSDLDGDVSSAEALCKRLRLYTTCDCSESVADDLATLYSACTYSSKDTYMSNYSIDDYSYTDYVNNSRSYTGISKSIETNAYYKYQMMQYIGGNSGRPYLGATSLKGLLGDSEDSLSTIIIIAASSIALISIASLSILIIKKRRSKEEE